MKSIFITFDQAHTDAVMFILDRYNCRGFSKWETIFGRGSKDGEAHFGSHAWPSSNSAIISIVEDTVVKSVLTELKELDEKKPKLGLRAFVWNIEDSI